MKKQLCWLVALGALLAFLSVSQAQETIKIGTVFPMSGPLASMGMESVRGYQIAARVQNERGGILGKKIELVLGDAKDPTSSVAEAERMASVEKVVAMCGSTASSFVLASSSVAEKYGVIYWASTAVSNEINERGFKYLFKTDPNSEILGRDQVRYVAEVIAPFLNMNPKDIKLGLVWENSSWGTSNSEGSRLEAKDRGMKIVSDHSYSYKTTDLSSVVMRLKTEKPDVIVAVCYVNDGILFTKQSHTLGFKYKALIGSGGAYNTVEWRTAVGNMGDGVFNVGYQNENINPAHVGDIGAKKFYELYQEMFKEMPKGGPYSVPCYMSFMALMDVLKKAGSTEAEAIRKAAVDIDIPDGKTLSGYGMKFYPPGHKRAGLNMRAYWYMQQWQDGALYTLAPKGSAMEGRSVRKP